ncbi:MAG: tagaturonate reductase [Oscillospiraceae bacterium]|jgi:tagaturonate reductase|nr:tagaturonate reductase [Oscillospiraceae bacterium]
MEQLSRKLPLVRFQQSFPEKVLMFGEGAFLRAFACYAIDNMNRKGLFGGNVTIIQPIPEGKIELLRKQEGLFTIVARGLENGEKTVKTSLVTCVSDYINPYDDYSNYIKRARNPELRFIISNTTEAGISYRAGESINDMPQASFPGKVTAFLYERFVFFNGDKKKGIIFLPCELIENNGAKLKELVLIYANEWGLSEDFIRWIDESCIFTNTLVDRIVAGYPHTEADKICNKLGYRDELLNACELFYFWAIEGPGQIRKELPLDKTGLNVVFSENITPYRLRKVRLLNGAHTCLAPAALLCGYKTVGEATEDVTFKKYLDRAIFKEIIPTLDINRNVLEGFAKAVFERFSNPYIRHELLGITLNCVSKFKTRVLPTILEYQRRFGELPPILTFSFAALIAFYKNGGRFKLTDEERDIVFLRDNKLDIIFKNISGAWDVDISGNLQLQSAVEESFYFIKKHGVKPLTERLVND